MECISVTSVSPVRCGSGAFFELHHSLPNNCSLSSRGSAQIVGYGSREGRLLGSSGKADRILRRADNGERRRVVGRAVAAVTSGRAVQEWTDLESDVAFLTRSARLVQWYPGHIAKAEKQLKEQLQVVDVVVEVRDCRIPLATCHPDLDEWIGDKKKILVLNRQDMVSTQDKTAWTGYFTSQGLTTILTDGQRGTGIMKLGRVAKSVAGKINGKRRAKGLLPRSVRAAVVGYPNVGKSSVINRLVKSSVCETAPRPGVTRDLKWTRIAEGLDLMDAPGVLPMRIQDQAAATRLAICNDIGEASYAVAGVGAVLVEMLKRIPELGPKVLSNRYKVIADSLSGEEFLEELGQLLFRGDINQAAWRVLRDFRKGKFGWLALERPPSTRPSSPRPSSVKPLPSYNTSEEYQ